MLMIIIKQGFNNTYIIEQPNCYPRNELGGLDKKDLRVIWKKIGKILMERDYRKEVFDKVL